MSKFVMPAEGTAEFDALKSRWMSKPVTFGQCGAIMAAFKDVAAAGGYAGKVGPKMQARLDHLSTRDADGRWLYVRTDSGELTMWGAHLLVGTLRGLLAGPVVESATTPKPAAEHRKVTVEAIEGDRVSGVVLESGQLVMVRTATGVETKRVLVNGARVTLGRP